jgi:transaldolase
VPTIEAFEDHGTVARTVDQGADRAREHLERLADQGIVMEDVAQVLEEEGVAAFSKSFDQLMQALSDKASALSVS